MSAQARRRKGVDNKRPGRGSFGFPLLLREESRQRLDDRCCTTVCRDTVVIGSRTSTLGTHPVRRPSCYARRYLRPRHRAPTRVARRRYRVPRRLSGPPNGPGAQQRTAATGWAGRCPHLASSTGLTWTGLRHRPPGEEPAHARTCQFPCTIKTWTCKTCPWTRRLRK